MSTRWLIGVSSGSTLDGVDAALTEVRGAGLDLRVHLLHFVHQPFPKDVREMLGQVESTAATPLKQLSLLHRLLGETLAQTAQRVADQASFQLHKIQCIGCPSRTIFHEVEGRYPSTLGLGMAAVIAERTGITTVSDFRARDVAAGGQGMPVTSLADFLMFHNSGEDRVLIDLGGMSSIVWLPADDGPRRIVGFQAGPCNVLLDGLMMRLTGGREYFDAWGKNAVQGRCIEPLLQRWLVHPVLQRRPPKCVSRHYYGEEFITQALKQAPQYEASWHDLLCTATHLAARAVAQALERYLPKRPQRILLSGGGVRNGFLWKLLQQQVGQIPLRTIEDAGFPVRSRKALAYSVLAALTLDGLPANLMSVTGATGNRLLGHLTPGSTANWARCVSWMAQQTTALAAA